MLEYLNRTMNDNVTVKVHLAGRAGSVEGDLVSVDEIGVTLRVGGTTATSVPMARIRKITQTPKDAF